MVNQFQHNALILGAFLFQLTISNDGPAQRSNESEENVEQKSEFPILSI